MNTKQVKQLLYAHQVKMGGMPVKQPLPTQQVDQIDPFLLLHHHNAQIPEAGHPRDLGVPPHPHRGFSPVTFVLQGDVHHRDSFGNSSIIHAGGVQWLDAGRGMTHSERPSEALAEKGGTQEIIQLWINQPQSQKMAAPIYQAAEKTDMPLLAETAGNHLRLVSGEVNGLKGAIQTKWPIVTVFGELKAGTAATLPSKSGDAAILYLINGKLKISGYGLMEQLHLARFQEQGEEVTIEAMEDSTMIYLSAKPINEPVVNYGPFVMNTQTEVMQAMRDFQMGKMGVLIEEF